MRRRRLDSRAFPITVGVLVALAAVPMFIVIAVSGAPGSMLVATVLASVPVVPLVLAYLWLDRYEPEPRILLGLGLLWGAFAATFAALVIEGVGSLAGVSDKNVLAVVAPITEEGCKGLFILMLLWWRRAELDGVLDGIVYAGMVGIGFAFTENILYLAAAYNGTNASSPGGAVPGGAAALTSVFVIRCLISPFAHPLFTAFTGIGVGLATNARTATRRFLYPLAGYAVACLLHGLWNASTLYGVGGYVGVYVLVMLPGLAGVVALAVWARTSERRMLAAALADAASRGLLPATDIGWVVDLNARRGARAYALQTGGSRAAKAMRRYQQAVIELGFLHSRYLRGSAPPDFAARGSEYVARIGEIRPFIAFPGQVVPTR
jgi:RsiW-degrading membrane proteinase PrsW (M82 family)